MIATLDRWPATSSHIIHAVIGVWYRGDRTFYVKRSEYMQNYPGAWSLFSIQYDPDDMPNSLDLHAAQRLMERMSGERLYGAPIRVGAFLTASVCTDNPLGRIVNLRLYQVAFNHEPRLNPRYYNDSAWMTAAEYRKRRGSGLCGSCLRAWFSFSAERELAAPSSLRDSTNGTPGIR